MIFPDNMAIVGNGPNELGKGKGVDIDKHEYVARFNNYRLEHVEDYGEKVNILVTGFSKIDRINFSKAYEYIYCPFPLAERDKRMPGFTKMLKQYVPKNSNVKFAPWGMWQSLLSITKKRPTAGMSFLWWVYSDEGTLKNHDLYGFEFHRSGKLHYFSGQPKGWKIENSRKVHNYDEEYSLYKRLLKQ